MHEESSQAQKMKVVHHCLNYQLAKSGTFLNSVGIDTNFLVKADEIEICLN